MDDRRTRDTLDHLADLFLTGISEAEDAAAAPVSKESPLEGPAPIRLEPKVFTTPQTEDDTLEPASFVQARTQVDRRRPGSEPMPPEVPKKPRATPSPAHDMGRDPLADKVTEVRPGLKLHHASPELRPELLNQVERVLHIEPEDPTFAEALAELTQAQEIVEQMIDPAIAAQVASNPALDDLPGHAPAENVAQTETPADPPTPEVQVEVSRDAVAEATDVLGRRVLGGEEPKPAAAYVEAVVLGNLPGLAGPWLTQYAQLLAEQDGPLVVVHVDEDALDLELIEPTAEEGDDAAAVRIPPTMVAGGGAGETAMSLLKSLLTAQVSPVRTILVHLSADATPETTERLLAIGACTLLSGADDAAVVAGYSKLKQFVDLEPKLHDKPFGLMVMGSSPERAKIASEKVSEAAEAFLKTPVELIGFQQQMVPANVRQLGTFTTGPDVWSDLASLIASLDEPGTRAAISSPQPDPVPELRSVTDEESLAVEAALNVHQDITDAAAADASPSIAETLAEIAKRRAIRSDVAAARPWAATTPSADDAPETVVVEQTPPTQPAAEVVEADAATVEVAVPQTAKQEPQRTVAFAALPDEGGVSELSLARLLAAGGQTQGSYAGLLSLEARCPYEPEVEMALDQEGRLHLLARHAQNAVETDGGADAAFEAMRDRFMRLIEAARWVREHRQLIILSQRQCHFDDQAEPAMHLFTDRPDTAVHVASRLGTMFHLHLLQQIHVGDQSTWFTTPIA